MRIVFSFLRPGAENPIYETERRESFSSKHVALISVTIWPLRHDKRYDNLLGEVNLHVTLVGWQELRVRGRGLQSAGAFRDGARSESAGPTRSRLRRIEYQAGDRKWRIAGQLEQSGTTGGITGPDEKQKRPPLGLPVQAARGGAAGEKSIRPRIRVIIPSAGFRYPPILFIHLLSNEKDRKILQSIIYGPLFVDLPLVCF